MTKDILLKGSGLNRFNDCNMTWPDNVTLWMSTDIPWQDNLMIETIVTWSGLMASMRLSLLFYITYECFSCFCLPECNPSSPASNCKPLPRARFTVFLCIKKMRTIFTPVLRKALFEVTSDMLLFFIQNICNIHSYMQKTCDVAEKAILAKKKLRKKCVNRDKM